MKVFLTIWITAVLIQEVIPGTLVRLPRHTPKHPALVETEYEAKYEQKGQNGNENSGLFSGKQEIVHDGCPGNWNAFADKCAALVKDLVASLASTVSSRPGDATKLQLQIKNTFRHFDNTHNCSCLKNRGKNITALDLSCLLNNITINTIAPTMNNNRNSTGAENEHEDRWGGNGLSSNVNNGSGLREGVVGLGSNGNMMNGDGDDDNRSSDSRDNNIGTLHSHPAGVSRKTNTTLDHAKNPGFSPENDEDSGAGSNSRRQAEYPQVSWQPGNKARHSQTNHGKSINVNRSLHPFIVTPQPNSAYGSPALVTDSDGNEISNGGNGFGSDGQTNSNASPAGGSGEPGIPLRIQTLPATNTYNSEPTSDSHYKAGVRVPATGSHNSPFPTGTGVPPAFDDHYGKVPGIPAPGGHNLKNGYSLSKAPVTDDSYDSKPVPVQPMTDGLSDSKLPMTPKFPTNNSPNSDGDSNKPQLVQSTLTSQTSENPQSSDSHALSKNQHNRQVAEKIQPASSLPSEDSSLNSIPRTPNAKPFLTTGRPKVSSSRKNKRVRVPVINSHSNIPESQWGTTNPLPTGGNPNPSTADLKTGSPAIPEVLPASTNDESQLTVFSPTTNKFSDTKTPPLDHVPPSGYVKPTLPEAYNHKSEDTSIPVAVTSSSLSQNSDTLGGSGSENSYGNPQMDVPVTVHPVYMATTMSPLGYNVDVKPEENSGSNGNYNSGQSNAEEDDCDENDAEDGGKTPETVLQPPEQSLQHTGRHQSNTEVGDSNVQNGIGQSTSVSKTNPDDEEYDDCEENTGSDPATHTGTGNDETAVVAPPVHPVSKTSDPELQVVRGHVPASHDGGENMGSGTHPNGLSGTVSSTRTTNDETPTVVPPGHPVSKTADPVMQAVQGNVPASDDHGENMRSSIHPSGLPGGSSVTGTTNGETTPVPASQVKHVSTVSDPVDRVLHENVPAPDDGDDGEDCDENTEFSGDATNPITVSPVQTVPVLSDPVQQVVQRHGPASDDHGENTGSSNNLNSPSDSAVSHVKPVPDPVSLLHENVPVPGVGDDGEDCDENTEPSNDATNSVAASPVKPLSTVSDPVVQGNDGSENMESDIHRNGLPGTGSVTGTTNDETTSVPASQVKHVPTVSDPTLQVVQGHVPTSHNGGENTGSGIHRNGLSGTSSVTGTVNDETTPVAVSPVQPVSTVSDPAEQVVNGNVPASEDGEDCDENTETINDETSVPVLQGNVPASDDHGENMRSSIHENGLPGASSVTGTMSDETTSVPGSQVKRTSTVSDPTVQVVHGKVPASDNHGEYTGSSNHPNSAIDSSSNTRTVKHATMPVEVSSVQPVSTASGPVESLLHENVPAPDDEDDCDENTEPSNDPTTSVAASQVKHIPTSDSVVKVIQGNVPASDDVGENMRSSIHRNGLSGTGSSTGTAKDETPTAVPSGHPVSKTADPVVQVVKGNVPVSDDGGENLRFGNHPNSQSSTSSSTGTTNDGTPSIVPPVHPVSKISDSEIMRSGKHPNSASESNSNTRTTNHATTPVAGSPVQPFSTISEPAGQSLHSGGSPHSSTGSGVDGVQNGNIQSTALDVTPLPYTNSPDGDTLMSVSNEGQSGNPGNEDSALYKPTTFQTTAADPTPPQSILIPTESTRLLTPTSPASHSTVGGSTSPLSKEGDDDDEDEDCCSCESCTDDVGDVKQYKENACKNLEEARRELKAIFDRIKKKLKCGRKV